MTTHIIAEIGVNHNGDLALAKEMINAAIGCGASSVKFQLFDANGLTSSLGPTSPYQKLAGYENMRNMLADLELSRDEIVHLFQYCSDSNVTLIVTPYSESDIDFLIEKCGASIIKVASMFCDDIPFIEHLASKDVDVILSTGMTTQAEVDNAVKIFSELGNRLCLLHCTTSYPTTDEDMNLKVITNWKERYACEVGLSDHGVGVTPSVCAVALGATVIEKHFTLDQTLPGPDQATSLNPAEFAQLCNDIKRTEILLGSSKKEKLSVELDNESVMKRGACFRENKQKGEVLAASDIFFQRPRIGLSPTEATSMIGRTLSQNVQKGQHLQKKYFYEN